MKRARPLALLCLAALLLAGCGRDAGPIIAAAIPELPDLEGRHPEFVQRIQAADTQARQGPDALAGLQELSRLYHANGLLREAWQTYSGLATVEPDEPRWTYRLAAILAGYGQLEDAIPLYSKTIKLAPDYLPARVRMGDTMLKLNRIDDAEAAHESALDKDPDNAYALVGMARVAIAREDFKSARAHLEKATRASDMRVGADLLADVLEQLGEKGQSLAVLASSVWGSFSDIPDPWIIALMDDCYDAREVAFAGGWAAHGNDKPTGIRLLSRAVELEPENSMNHYQLGLLRLGNSQPQEAQKSFQRCVEIKPDFSDAWLQLIEIARREGNRSRAASLLRQALARCPESPSLHIERGNDLLEARRFGEALFHYERSIELRPNEAVGYVQLARAHFVNGDPAAGVAAMREALRVEPAHALALSTMALDAIMRGDRAEADSWIRRLAEQPRIGPKEVNELREKYIQKFGR